MAGNSLIGVELSEMVSGLFINTPEISPDKVLQWANFPPGIQLLDSVRKPRPLQTYPVIVEGGRVFVEV